MAAAKDRGRVFSVRVGKPFFFEEAGRFGDEPDPRGSSVAGFIDDLLQKAAAAFAFSICGKNCNAVDDPMAFSEPECGCAHEFAVFHVDPDLLNISIDGLISHFEPLI